MSSSGKKITGRAVTLNVAASDAPTLTKSMADYVCDGTDDQTEINAALTALPAAGGIVQLSAGTFNINATISTVKASSVLRGQGVQATQLVATSTIPNAPLLTIAHQFCQVESMTLNGSKGVNGGKTSLLLVNVSGTGVLLRDLWCIDGPGNNINLTGVGPYVENVYSAGAVGVGFNCSGAPGSGLIGRMVSCHAYGNLGVSGFYVAQDHWMLSDCFANANTGPGFYTISTADNASFTGCYASGNTGAGFLLDGPDGTVRSCSSFGNGGPGFQSNAIRNTFLSCYSRTNTGSGFIVNNAGANRNTFVGCHSTANAAYGFYFAVGDYNLISGCYAADHSLHGMVIPSSNNCIIGNYILSNGTAGAIYSQIYNQGNSNFYQGNTIRRPGATPNYGLEIAGGAGCLIGQNDWEASGSIAAYFDSAGTNTRKNIRTALNEVLAANTVIAPSTANTWQTFWTTGTFRVSSPMSIVRVAVRGTLWMYTAGGANQVGSTRIQLSPGGQTAKIGGATTQASNQQMNVLAGSSVAEFTGLNAGMWQVFVQVRAISAVTFQCDAATTPETNHMACTVTEYQP